MSCQAVIVDSFVFGKVQIVSHGNQGICPNSSALGIIIKSCMLYTYQFVAAAKHVEGSVCCAALLDHKATWPAYQSYTCQHNHDVPHGLLQ